MRHVTHDKYFLKDLLREIDLYDRKLEHLRHHETFELESNRDRAVKTATTRRTNLTTTARKLMAEGIEYDQNALPASMLEPGQERKRNVIAMELPSANDSISMPMPVSVDPVAPAESADDEEHEQTPFGHAIERLQEQAKTAGMPQVNWQQELLDYKRKRNKVPAA